MKHACLEEDRNSDRYRDKSGERQRKAEWDRNEKSEVKKITIRKWKERSC